VKTKNVSLVRASLLGAALAVLFSPAAHAVLTLNATGIADGFSLSTFLSGGSGYTFLGSANLSDGTIAVGGFASGQIFKFNDVDNQTLGNALATVSFSGEIDLANAGGNAYAASRNTGFFRVANNLALTAVIPNPAATPTEGMAGNPVNGHLVANTSAGLVDINPTTGVRTFISSPPGGTPDGVTVSPDGTIAYTAIFGGSAVLGYNISTGALVFSATGLPGGPDGTAIISGGAFNGFIVVNNNDGSVGLINPTTAVETIIATGGTRGDFVSPDLSNGSLFLFEDNAALRLSIAGGSIGGGGGSVPDSGSSALMLLGSLATLGFLRRAVRK
jgi:hypothetical protein